MGAKGLPVCLTPFLISNQDDSKPPTLHQTSILPNHPHIDSELLLVAFPSHYSLLTLVPANTVISFL